MTSPVSPAQPDVPAPHDHYPDLSASDLRRLLVLMEYPRYESELAHHKKEQVVESIKAKELQHPRAFYHPRTSSGHRTFAQALKAAHGGKLPAG